MDISELEYFEGPHKKIPLVIKNGFKVCINFGFDKRNHTINYNIIK